MISVTHVFQQRFAGYPGYTVISITPAITQNNDGTETLRYSDIASTSATLGLVRLEAAIAASYIGTPEALEAALDLLKHPMDPYLTYALRTSVDSHTLQPLWKGNTVFMQKHPELEKFLKDSEPTKPALMAKKKKPEPPNPFDNQPGLQTITIKTIPERLLYDLREFKVAPGAPVKLVFENPDVTPHNLLIVQPCAADEVGMAGNEMAKTPDGFAKGFIPDSPKILHKTKMLNQGDREVLRFTAPTANTALVVLVEQGIVREITGHRRNRVFSYTEYLNEIDAGRIENIAAPHIAIEYWKLATSATLRDVVIAVRKDEEEHREGVLQRQGVRRGLIVERDQQPARADQRLAQRRAGDGPQLTQSHFVNEAAGPELAVKNVVAQLQSHIVVQGTRKCAHWVWVDASL